MSTIYVHKYVLSLHYITFGNAPSNYNICLASEWGKFKLAKQHDSNIRPEVLLFHSKG